MTPEKRLERPNEWNCGNAHKHRYTHADTHTHADTPYTRVEARTHARVRLARPKTCDATAVA